MLVTVPLAFDSARALVGGSACWRRGAINAGRCWGLALPGDEAGRIVKRRVSIILCKAVRTTTVCYMLIYSDFWQCRWLILLVGMFSGGRYLEILAQRRPILLRALTLISDRFAIPKRHDSLPQWGLRIF